MNQDNKKQVIIAGFLGVVLVGVLFYQLVLSGGPSSVPAVSDKVASNTTAPSKPVTSQSSSHGDAPGLDDSSSLDRLGAELDALVEKVSDVTFRYKDEKIIRNPFAPVRIMTTTDVETGQPIDVNIIDKIPKDISGIIFDEEVPYAVIEDNLVTVGHRFAEGVVLEKIERTQVIIKVGDAEIPLKLMKEQ